MCSRADDPTMHDAAADESRGLTRCWQYQGWHVYAAGPCFDTRDEAVAYRDALDARGLTWWPQDKPLPTIQSATAYPLDGPR